MSKGEERIAKLLSADHIKFTREKTFQDLSHGKLRFDFYVELASGPVVIEFQGEQHYKFISAFYKTKREWRQAQGRDMRKISYCLAHDIPIYVIPYWDLAKLQSAEQLFSEQYRARNRFQNFTDLSDKFGT